MSLVGELDVSDDLINLFYDMVDKKKVKYVPIEKATKRELGVAGQQQDPHFARGEKGVLQEFVADDLPPADLSTDLRVDLAMQRLGLAADMAELLSYDKHDGMRLALQQAKLDTPPPGYAPVSLTQVLNAHREFWNQLAARSQGIVSPVGGVRPLDALVTPILDSRRFQQFLMFLPVQLRQPKAEIGNASGTAPAGSVVKKPTKADRKRKALERAAEAARGEERAKLARFGTSASQPLGKGKSKGRGHQPLPRQLVELGCTADTPSGDAICFSFNLPGGCTSAAPGGKCGCGLHVCAKCYEPHSAHERHPR